MTAHDKLIELDWEWEDYDDGYKHYSKKPCVLSIDLINKRYIIGYDNPSQDDVEMCFVDLPLAKVLVEYLEELEKNK